MKSKLPEAVAWTLPMPPAEGDVDRLRVRIRYHPHQFDSVSRQRHGHET